MASREQARRAKEQLRKKLGRPNWLRGVGISRDALGYFVRVNVEELTADVKLPPKVLGVMIKVHEVGEIRAAPSRAVS